jgi:single-stranded-DNA-specific exonuclease
MKSNLKIRWVEPENVNIPAEFVTELGLSKLVAASLVRRGFITVSQARAFLDAPHYQPADPYDLPDLQKGVERLQTAIQRGETIGVWGDFDVDGQTSTTLLVDVLRGLEANVIYHIPVRERESHGVTLPALSEFLEQGVNIVLTCDTGITAHEAVIYARNRNIDFIITDHHTLPDHLPVAFATINPQRLAQDHPLRQLPGVGTAFQLAKALTTQMGKPEQVHNQLDLVALGTLADLAHLTQDTRYLVQLGLDALRSPLRVGLIKLMELAEVNPANLNEEHIGFAIAPRLNAIGRLSDANPVVDFLTTNDANQAAVFAARLEGLNAERRFLTEQIFKGAITQIEQDPGLLDQAAIVLAHPSWPGGVVGIVASRLVELFQRPAILLSGPPDGILRGSARSIDGVNITTAIASAGKLLHSFGGHPMAAGMALDASNLAAFRRKVCTDVERQFGEVTPEREIKIDAYIALEEISLDLVTDLEQLAPFGPGNPPVMLATRSLTVRESTPIGKNDEHLLILVEDDFGTSRRVIWWQGARSLLPQGRFDLAFTIRANNFRGQPEVQLEWIAAREMIDPAVEIATESEPIEIIDLRDSPDPLSEIERIAEPHTLFAWAEKQPGIPFQGVGLDNLPSVKTFIIWNPPPGRDELRHTFKAVRPKQLILCNVPGSPDEPRALLERLTGMVRYALRKHSGTINLPEIAAALNQPKITVELGLFWLVARGFIRIISNSEGAYTLAQGGVPNNEDTKRLQSLIQIALQETAAFRAWYGRVDPEQIN